MLVYALGHVDPRAFSASSQRFNIFKSELKSTKITFFHYSDV